MSERTPTTIKSFHGDSYPDVGRQAFEWAEEHHGLGRVAPETVRRMRADCAMFRLDAGDVADEFEVRDVAGDFWCERNGRRFGGFLDGDYPEPAASTLTRVARGFPPFALYLDGEDDLVRSR